MALRFCSTFFALTILALGVIQAVQAEKQWSFSFLSIETYTSDPESVVTGFSRKTVGRNKCALSGFLDFKKALTEETTFFAKSYHSKTGNTDFKPIPLQVPKQNYIDFFNGFYKDCLMEDLKNCSNLPYFEDKFEPPLGPKKYELTDCIIETEKYPDTMQPGYYKFEGKFEGTITFNATFLVKVEVF